MRTEWAIRPYFGGDWRLVRPRPQTAHQKSAVLYPALFDHAFDADNVIAATLTHVGAVVACAGVMRLSSTLGEAWASFPDPSGWGLAPSRLVLAACRKNIAAAETRWGLRRIEAFCDAEFAAGHRFLYALGFRPLPQLLRHRSAAGRCDFMFERLSDG